MGLRIDQAQKLWKNEKAPREHCGENATLQETHVEERVKIFRTQLPAYEREQTNCADEGENLSCRSCFDPNYHSTN
jgi:hypothetical protein